MTAPWKSDMDGVLELPSGRRIRGRGLRNPLPAGQRPSFGVYLLGRKPPEVKWESRWIRWPDFWLPSDRDDAVAGLREALDRSADERVELACSGGKGRTGTALSLLAVLDGVPSEEAVGYVRARYSKHAVETLWQRRYVARFRPEAPE
jgi:protein-tyrosine phosphatase